MNYVTLAQFYLTLFGGTNNFEGNWKVTFLKKKLKINLLKTNAKFQYKFTSGSSLFAL